MSIHTKIIVITSILFCSCFPAPQGLIPEHRRMDDGMYLSHIRQRTYQETSSVYLFLRVLNDAPVPQHAAITCMAIQEDRTVWEDTCQVDMARYEWQDVMFVFYRPNYFGFRVTCRLH